MRADVSGADLTRLATALSGDDGRLPALALQALALVDAPPLPGRPLTPEDIERPWREAMPGGT
jgi:hypothetical protein